MTRARKTLTLAKTGDSNPFLRILHDHSSVLVRPEPEFMAPAPPELGWAYHRLSLRDVQLSFAGYRPPGHPVHRAIAGLSPGDLLQIRTDRSPWELATVDGFPVGRLAQGYRVPAETGDVSATVLAIAAWDKAKSGGEIPRPAQERAVGSGDSGDSHGGENLDASGRASTELISVHWQDFPVLIKVPDSRPLR